MKRETERGVKRLTSASMNLCIILSILTLRPDNETEDDETPSLNQTRETTSKEEANNQDHSSDKAAGRSSGVNSEMTTKWMEYVEKVELSETAEPKAETSGEAWERLMEQTIEKLNKKEEVLCPKNVRCIL